MNTGKASLLILYTGGTIGMVQDSSTGALKPFRFDNILEEVPELKKFGYNLSSYAFDPPIDSSDMKPEVWIKMAEIIESNYDKFDGFIILHGTDTMAYSASALSFMLENLQKPVIFTGSQLPLGSLRTDAKENLISSIEIAAAVKNGKPVVPEVGIFFENRLYRGNRTSKNNTEDFNAFISGNYPALAESGVHIRFNDNALLNPSENPPLIVHKNLDTRLAVLKLFPGLNRHVAEAVLKAEGLRALIIETFGAGNAPNEPWFISCMKEAVDRGIIVVNITQCRIGHVAMGTYETSRNLANAGVIGGSDMTLEAAVTKLMFLLGTYDKKNTIEALITKSIR
ncbi:MAG: type I asparaginase, partial [Bacteroidales bacterium]|nr:type I asparaginase [Bacteroidales bacterium]